MFKRTFELAKYGMLIPYFAFLHSLNAQIIMANHHAGIRLDENGKKYFMEPFNGRYAKISAGGYFGLTDSSGKIIIPVQYDFISNFEGGFAVVKLDGKQGLINQEGSITIPLKYDYVEPFYHGAAVVGLYNKYALINQKGQEITPFKYDVMSNPSWYDYLGRKKGFFVAEYNWQPYILDSLGREIDIPIDVIDVKAIYPNGIILLKTNSGHIFMHPNGRELTKVNHIVKVYEKLYSSDQLFLDCLSSNLFSIQLGADQVGLIDSLGNELLTFEYTSIENFANKGLILEKGGKSSVVDYEFKTVLPFKKIFWSVYDYDDNDDYEWKEVDSLLWASDEGGRGLMNEHGDIKIPMIYDQLASYEKGLLVAEKNEKHGLIDMNGNTVIDLIYNNIEYMGDGIYAVGKQWKVGLLNTKGEILYPFISHQPLYPLKTPIEGLVYVFNESGSQMGCMDRYGNMVIPIEYDYLHFTESGLALARKNGNAGYIDVVGTPVIPIQYGTHSSEFRGHVGTVFLNHQSYFINKKGQLFLDEALTKKYVPIENKEETNQGQKVLKDCGFDTDIYMLTEISPEFPGGEEAMQNFIYANLQYPKEAKIKSVEGQVFVNILIDCNGYVKNAEVDHGIGEGCDEEAIRIVLSMPPWKPAMQDGQTVNLQLRIAIDFFIKKQ